MLQKRHQNQMVCQSFSRLQWTRLAEFDELHGPCAVDSQARVRVQDVLRAVEVPARTHGTRAEGHELAVAVAHRGVDRDDLSLARV